MTVTVPQPLRPLSEGEFARFQSLIARESGIHLTSMKMALLSARLSRRIRELGLRDFKSYHRYVTERGEEEIMQMLDCVCTNETRFFREPKQFEFLEKRYFPRRLQLCRDGRAPNKLRIWSAACSTGEEPYSIAMSVAATLPGWHVQIIASDLSRRALGVAARAVWPVTKSEEIPEHYLKSFMLRGVGPEEGKMRAGEEIRSMIEFRRINLSADAYPLEAHFDLIFCRNALIYFDRSGRDATIRRLLRLLSPGGLLLLGHSESLAGGAFDVRAIAPTVYMRAEDARRE
jgi:chemotaxis protein methyltransferase CheR